MQSVRAAYEDTAWGLDRSLHLPDGRAYITKLTLRGKNTHDSLSSEEIDRLHADIDACASELSKGVVDPPPETVRTVQVLKCMEPRGWYVTVDVGYWTS